uniref:C2H2-type domain-containing protein n=1 Tax=Ditylenchus dipsaci TaxID=166011 RepID=A0A915E7S5_9BILA
MASSSSTSISNNQQTTTSTLASSGENGGQTTSSSAYKVLPEADEFSENNMNGFENLQHQQFGMDNDSLQRLMMAAASMDNQSNPMHNFYLSQLQQATAQPSESSAASVTANLTPSSTNPTPTNEPETYANMAAAAAAQQRLLEQLFGSAAINSQLSNQDTNSEHLNNSKNNFQPEPSPTNNNSVSGFGDLNANELAQIMASLISNGSGNELVLQNGTHAKGQCQNSNGQSSNPASTAPSQPVSPNSQQQNSSNVFDQLQLLNLFGAGNGLPVDFFGSSASNQMPNSTSHNQISQMAGMSGPDFASLAAGLGLGNPLNGMDASNNQAVAAAAALLAASSGSFSFSGSPNKSLDSYCEICDKNLCNRYFLKTHKLKKHGISDDGTTGSPIKTNFGQTSFDAESYINRAISTSSTNANPLQSSVIVSAANNFVGDDRNLSGDSSPMAKMPKLSSSSTSAPNMMAGLMAGNGSNNVAQLNERWARTADTEQRTPTRSPVENQPFNNPFNEPTNNNTANASPDYSARRLFYYIITEQPKDYDFSNLICSCYTSICRCCYKLKCPIATKYQQILNNLLPAGLQLPFLMPSQLAQFGGDLGEAQAAMAKMSGAGTPGTVSSPTAQGSGLQQAKNAAKRQYSSTSKNYCDLCNKEVCNKYFLRTHMLKMHNIEKAGSISFRCDICMVELKTRNDLRVHKKETHGVVPLLTPPANSGAHVHNGSVTPSRTPKSATFNPHLMGGLSANRLSQHQQQLQQHFFGPTLDEPTQMPALQKDEPEFDNDDGQGNAANADHLTANVEMILNSIAACRPLETKVDQIKKEECLEDANSLDNNIPSSSASSTFEAANSATSSASSSAFKCRFCNDHFGDEMKMQLHAISNHSAEIFGQFADSLGMLTGGGQLPTADENDVITRVALKMAQANQALNQPMPASIAQFTCMHCNRRYKSKLSLANHTRSVHHNFVAKLSPTKKSKRPVISPKKVKKLRSCFTCMKCQRRFSTRIECSEHVIGHLRAEKEQGQILNSLEETTIPELEIKKEKLVRSNSEDKLYLIGQQDSNNNSASHGCRSLPDQDTQMETHEDGIKSAQLTYEETFLNTFIKEESNLEDSQPLILEMPGAEATSSHSSGCMSFDDEALLLIDEQEQNGSHHVVNQVVSEIHEEQCRLQSQPKDEKHSHTSTPDSEDQQMSKAHTLVSPCLHCR